jgi:hypothetical protein
MLEELDKGGDAEKILDQYAVQYEPSPMSDKERSEWTEYVKQKRDAQYNAMLEQMTHFNILFQDRMQQAQSEERRQCIAFLQAQHLLLQVVAHVMRVNVR